MKDRSGADLETLLADIRACRACAGDLPHEPRPVITVKPTTRLLIAGQAPGRRVHESGVPFDDPSGERLRSWMGVDRNTFYEHPAFGVAAMAFCYPGTVKGGGDIPPPRPLRRAVAKGPDRRASRDRADPSARAARAPVGVGS